MSFVTRKTWDILGIVNETIDENGKINVMPYKGAYMDQPPWYKKAVSVVRSNRAAYLKEKANNG